MAFTPLYPAQSSGQSGPTPSFTPIGAAPAPSVRQAPAPDPNLPNPGRASFANLGYNLSKIPGQLSELATRLPGATLGKAVGNSIGSLGVALPLAFQGKISQADAALKPTPDEPSIPQVAGDAVQAMALPASLAIGGPAGSGFKAAATRVGVNSGFGALLGGASTAANGGSAADIATNAGYGALAAGGTSTAFEGYGALKNLINGSTDPFSSALKRVTPDYENSTPTQKGKFVEQHSLETPRIQEGGTVTGRSLIPNDTEKAAAAEVAKIPGYQSNATNLETHALVKSEIARQGQGLETALQNENIIVPKQEINSIITNATADIPDESTLIARGDAPLAKYVRAAKASVADNDGTLAGVLNVRKELDQAYEIARGKLAYTSDKLAPLDEIHQEARNALNDYLIAHAQNVDVKAALKSQSLLFRAGDVLQTKAAQEGGSTLSRVQSAIKTHPVGAGFTAAGTGVAAYEGIKRMFTGSF